MLTVVSYTDQPVSDDPGGLTTAYLTGTVDPRSAAPLNVQFHAGESLDQQRIGFVFTTPAGERGTIKARNYYAWRDFGNLLPTFSQGIVDLERDFVGGGVSYNYDGFWLDRPNRFVAGADFDDQDDDRRRYDNQNGVQGPLSFDQNEHVKSYGVFLQNDLSISQRVQLSFGVRYDEVEFVVTDRWFLNVSLSNPSGDDSGSKKFTNTSPMVGLTVQLTDKVNLYTTYSSAFETPTTTEFSVPGGGGGFNQELVPQEASNYEVGLRGGIGDSQRYEISLFTIDVEDELIGNEIPTSPGRFFFTNAASRAATGSSSHGWRSRRIASIRRSAIPTRTSSSTSSSKIGRSPIPPASTAPERILPCRESGVCGVLLPRAARLVHCSRRALRRRAVRRQREHGR